MDYDTQSILYVLDIARKIAERGRLVVLDCRKSNTDVKSLPFDKRFSVLEVGYYYRSFYYHRSRSGRVAMVIKFPRGPIGIYLIESNKRGDLYGCRKDGRSMRNMIRVKEASLV